MQPVLLLFLLASATTSLEIRGPTAPPLTTTPRHFSHPIFVVGGGKVDRSTLIQTSTSSLTSTPTATPPPLLSVGTNLGILDSVASQGITKPTWSISGDSNLAVDLADYQSSLSLYVTAPATTNPPIVLHRIVVTSGTLLQVTTTIAQPTLTSQPPPQGTVEIALKCLGPGRSHVTISLYTAQKNVPSPESTEQKALTFRFKKRCGALSRPGLNIGTSSVLTSNIVHNGKVQPTYRSAAPSAWCDQSNGTYVTLQAVLEQLSIGTASGTQQYMKTVVDIVPSNKGQGRVEGAFNGERLLLTKEARKDLHIVVLCTFAAKVHEMIQVRVTMTPEHPYQVSQFFVAQPSCG